MTDGVVITTKIRAESLQTINGEIVQRESRGLTNFNPAGSIYKAVEDRVRAAVAEMNLDSDIKAVVERLLPSILESVASDTITKHLKAELLKMKKDGRLSAFIEQINAGEEGSRGA